MSDEITRVEFQPSPERRTPQEPEEQRSFLSALASDANQIGTDAVSAAVIYGAAKLAGKIRGGGEPPTAGQSQGQDAASPKAD
jgi:hypothetical protein